MAASDGAASISGWALIATSATPTLIVCILGGVGAALAHKGILDSPGCQVVARMCFFVFVPALIFSKLVQAVSLASIAHLWPLLANMTASIIVGLGIGMAVARLTRTPADLRNIVVCAVAFGNVGNLPLVFVSSLCHDRQAMFYRALGEQCEHKGTAYTAFDIAAATLLQFTLGIQLLRRGAAASAALKPPGSRGSSRAASLELVAAEAPAVRPPADGEGGSRLWTPPPPPLMRKEPTLSDLLKARQAGRSSSSGSSPRGEPPSQQQQQQQQQHFPVLAPPHPLTPYPAALLQPQPASPSDPNRHGAVHRLYGAPALELQPVAFQPHPQQQQAAPLGWIPGQPLGWSPGQQHAKPTPDTDAEDDTTALLGSSRRRGAPAVAGRSGTGGGSGGGGGGNGKRRWWGGRAWRYLRSVDWGTAFPLPSQAAVLGIAVGCIPPLKSLLYSPHPPLRVFSEALDSLGAGMIPTNIPLLGAVLYRGPGASRLPLRVTLAVLVTRLVLQPALLTALVVGALRLRLFTPPDSMFLLTMLLSHTTPTAVNLQTMAVLYKSGEGEMASLLFWQYLASVLTLPAYMSLFLRIISAVL